MFLPLYGKCCMASYAFPILHWRSLVYVAITSTIVWWFPFQTCWPIMKCWENWDMVDQIHVANLTSSTATRLLLLVFCMTNQASSTLTAPTTQMRNFAMKKHSGCLMISCIFWESTKRTVTAKLHASMSSKLISVEATSASRSSLLWNQTFFQLPLRGWVEVVEVAWSVMCCFHFWEICHRYVCVLTWSPAGRGCLPY